jgi:hypothetical protein
MSPRAEWRSRSTPGYIGLEGVSLSSFLHLPVPCHRQNLQVLGFLGLCFRYSDGQHPMLVEGMGLIRIYHVGQP